MTRKDFELIAGVLRTADEVIDQYAIEALAEMFADRLAKTNPNFNRELFIVKSTSTTEKRNELLSALGTN